MFSTPGFCFVGIDGGATRTIVRVEDARGETLIQQAARDRATWGGAGRSKRQQSAAVQPAGWAGIVYRTMVGGIAAIAVVRCESDSVSGALLMIRKAVQDQPLAETGKK